MNKRSKIWLIDKEELQNIFNNSNSKSEILIKLGFNSFNGNHRILNKRIIEDNIDISILENRRKSTKSGLAKMCKKDSKDIFVENSKYNTGTHIKNRLINEGFIEYKCENCGIKEWDGKPISLQLDHINGINNDNRIENLRLLCPNCHSQTKTFSGKKNKKSHICLRCGQERKCKNSNLCVKCSNETKKRKVEERPSLICLESLVNEIGYTETGRKFNVSDNCIRKWIKKYKSIQNNK